MFSKTTLFALIQLAVFGAWAGFTNEVDVVSLGRQEPGLHTVTHWEVVSLSNYSESYHNALRFNVKSSLAMSPTYPQPVTRVVLQTVSSAAAFRRLMFTPNRKGVALTNLVAYCAYSPTKNIFVPQTITWPAGARVDSFTISLEEGGSTAWGIRSMTVIGEDQLPCGFCLRLR